VVCGAGGELLSAALRSQADVLLTGELRFHDYLAARAEGLALCLPGHYATERCGAEELAARLQERWPDVDVWASPRERDPVTWIGWRRRRVHSPRVPCKTLRFALTGRGRRSAGCPGRVALTRAPVPS